MSLPFRSILLIEVWDRLRIRIANGETQSALARECGVCQGTISRWMSSETNSGSALKLEQALRALGGRIKVVPARPVRLHLVA